MLSLIFFISLMKISTADTIVSKNEDFPSGNYSSNISIELKLVNRETPIPIANANIVVFFEGNQFGIYKTDLNGLTSFTSVSNNDSLNISISAPNYYGVKTRVPNKRENYTFYIPPVNPNSEMMMGLRKFPFSTNYKILTLPEFTNFNREIFSQGFWPFYDPESVPLFEYIKDTFPYRFVPRPNNWPQNTIRILCNSTIKDNYTNYPMMSQYQSLLIFQTLDK